MEMPSDFRVMSVRVIPITEQLIITYSYTDGTSIKVRSIQPEIINKPPVPPIDLGSIWD